MKLLVFDVDGTLIDYEQNILDSTIKAINLVLGKGDYIAIASGRPFPGVKKYLNYFDNGKKYAICSNGASVYSYNGTKYFEDGLTIKDLKKVFNLYKNLLDSINIFCFLDGKVGFYKQDFWTNNECRLNDTEPINLNEVGYDDNKIIEKVIISGKPEIMDKLKIKEKLFNEYHIVRSSKFFYDFMKNGVDKSSGVNFLYKKLNLNKEDVYTFGDADNDFHMIKDFNGVAMGNSVDNVKKVANFITKDVTAGGISYAIKNYLRY